jgi:hypothetical protein
VGLHVDLNPAHVGIKTTSPDTPLEVDGAAKVDGYTFEQNTNGHLEITTPSGNTILLRDNGDVEAFA